MLKFNSPKNGENLMKFNVAKVRILIKIYSSKNGENLMKLKPHKYKYLVGTPCGVLCRF